ncbi:hypothetical protein LCGC14_1846890 [marine sediment metagenome]|uniref:Uncharacterized protein n=1 Tax=marine sediment metagenome TaxID=412755 RepID=A0A0F9GZR2_9ZZZZ
MRFQRHDVASYGVNGLPQLRHSLAAVDAAAPCGSGVDHSEVLAAAMATDEVTVVPSTELGVNSCRAWADHLFRLDHGYLLLRSFYV